MYVFNCRLTSFLGNNVLKDWKYHYIIVSLNDTDEQLKLLNTLNNSIKHSSYYLVFRLQANAQLTSFIRRTYNFK